MKKLVIFLLLLACMPLEIGSAESEHKVHVRLMPVDVEKKDSGNIEVIDLPDNYTGNPETGSRPGSGDSPDSGDSPGRGGAPGTGDSPGNGDTPEKGEGQEKGDSPDTGGGVWSWLGDQVSKFTDKASNVASDLWTWGKEKASEIGEHVASAAEKTWEWVKENKEFVAVTAVGVTLTVAGVFFPPLLPFGVSILAGEAISGGVSYAFGARGKDLCKEMALGGALSVVGMGVGSLAAKVGRPLVANLLASRPVASLLTAAKNSRAAAWVASGVRMEARPFQVIGSRLSGAVNSLARGVQAAGNSAVRWLQRSRVASALVGMAKGVTCQVGTLVQALRNSAAGRAAAQFGSQVARTMQATLSRIAVPFYRQTRGSEAAAGVSSSIADDKMRGKDVSWTKAILSGGLAALLVFGGSAAQKQVNLLPSASEAKPAVVQNVDVASGDAYDVLRKHKIPTTLTDEEIQLAKQLDMRMEYNGTGTPKSIGHLVRDGTKIKYTNIAGSELTWVDQHPKNINRDIDNGLNSKDPGKAAEAKVASVVREKKEVTGFGQKIQRADNSAAGDLDVVTKDEIIEVKKSLKAVTNVDQFDKYVHATHADYFNPDQKKVILYIEKPLTNLHQNDVKKLEAITSKGVIIVNSLDDLKEVLK